MQDQPHINAREVGPKLTGKWAPRQPVSQTCLRSPSHNAPGRGSLAQDCLSHTRVHEAQRYPDQEDFDFVFFSPQPNCGGLSEYSFLTPDRGEDLSGNFRDLDFMVIC